MCIRNDDYFEMSDFQPGEECRCGGAAPLCLNPAIAITFGLASLLTLLEVPVFYAALSNIKIDPDGRVWNLQDERVDQPNQCAKPYDTHDAHFKVEQGNESGCADQRREPLKGAVKPFRP